MTMQTLAKLSVLCAALAALTGGCVRYNIDEDGYHLFHEPNGFYSTNEVLDVDGEVMRFDADDDLVVFDRVRYGGWPVDKDTYLIREDGLFMVRFGTEDGEPHAYFTETEPGTVCDAVVEMGEFRVFPTNVRVPET